MNLIFYCRGRRRKPKLKKLNKCKRKLVMKEEFDEEEVKKKN